MFHGEQEVGTRQLTVTLSWVAGPWTGEVLPLPFLRELANTPGCKVILVFSVCNWQIASMEPWVFFHRD